MKKTFLLLLLAPRLAGQHVTLREPNRNVAYYVPEAYELVNVAFALTVRGLADRNMVGHNSESYRRVMTRFDAHWQHALVVSPLVGSTHSTTRIGRQCVMWVSDDAGYDTTRFTEAQIRGIYTGVVFTGIDHNYVNPVFEMYASRIAQTFGDRSKGTSAANPTASVNEWYQTMLDWAGQQ